MNLEATPIRLTDEERATLESLVRSPKTEQRLAERAALKVLALMMARRPRLTWSWSSPFTLARMLQILWAQQHCGGRAG
jgi:hypothetical protein